MKSVIMSNNTKNEMKIEHHAFELLDLTDEILLKIFSNFNDIDLMNAAQVCRRFDAIAKEIAGQKYSGDSSEKYYEINLYSTDTKDDEQLYRTFLEMFGSKIAAIKITSVRAPNRYNMLKFIGQHCRSTKYLEINGSEHEFHLDRMIRLMSKLITLNVKSIHCLNSNWADIRFPHLKTLTLNEVRDVDVEVLKRFLYINPQLIDLHIVKCPRFPLKVIQALRDKMKRLKSLEYQSSDDSFGSSCRNINMEQLESLKIAVDGTSFRSVLEAIARGSKLINKLEVLMCDEDTNLEGIHDQMDDVIPLFEKLTFLRLELFDITLDVTRLLVRLMPHLITLKLEGVKLFEFHPNDILYILKKCKHMKELVLDGKLHRFETNKLNLEFYQQFTDIIRGRGSDAKFELIQPDTKVKLTAEKMILNGELIHWTEYEASKSDSKVHFLDLNDKCLSRIYSYLDEQSERSLYETCTRTKGAMNEQIMKQVFTVSDLNSAKDTFNRFGEHIKKLAIDINLKNHAQTTAIWSYIATKYSEKIIELSLVNVKVSAVDSIKVNFPNLTTLKIMSLISSRTHIFPSMECPKLSLIEFHKGDIIFATKASNFGVTLDCLTTIRLSNFNNSIVKILYLLDNKTCDHIQELSIEQVNETIGQHIQFTNIAMRFRNLTTLNYNIDSIEVTNTKYLFASCTKLVKLTVRYLSYSEIDDWRRTVRNIKENCKQLDVIQLIHSIRFDYGVDQSILNEIANTLPNVKFYIISYDDKYETYRVTIFKKITKADRIKPF